MSETWKAIAGAPSNWQLPMAVGGSVSKVASGRWRARLLMEDGTRPSVGTRESKEGAHELLAAETTRANNEAASAAADANGVEPLPAPPTAEEIAADMERQRVMFGKARPLFVYFIQANAGGPIKIGKAINVGERLEQLQAGCPIQLRVIATMPATKNTEADLHCAFQDFRLHGEWFTPAPELLAFIAKHAEATP